MVKATWAVSAKGEMGGVTACTGSVTVPTETAPGTSQAQRVVASGWERLGALRIAVA